MMTSHSITAKEAEGKSTMVPNWLELPFDVTANILQRLDTIDIVTSACQVCPLWWNICKNPSIWRTIRMTNLSFFHSCYLDLVKICRYVVQRSCGHLIDIDIEYFGTDELLECIAENANNIRCMRLANCISISDKGFTEAVRKLPQLEEVNISSMYNLSKDSLEVLGRSCPHLKSLEFARVGWAYMRGAYDDEAVIISETMSRLCRLDIKGNGLSDFGLLAILDRCPLLEYLDIRECYNLELNETLRERCLEQIKDLRLPILDYYEDYYHDAHISNLTSLDDDHYYDLYDDNYFDYNDPYD